MTDSYVPTLNADGDIQNVATQQSERGGATIETQEFALTAAQLATLTPPANPDPSTETKQDDLITAIGTLQTTVEALTTAVGLLAKLTDTQPVDAGYSKVSTLNSASGTFSGSSDGGTPIWTGTFEVVDDYGELFVSVNMPDATENLMIIIEESINGSDVYDTSMSVVSAEQCKLNGSITHRYLRVTVYCVVGAGDHNYDVVTVFKKKGLQSFPYVLDPSGNNTRLHEDGSGRLLTMITPDGDLWAYLGSREDARSTATDTTAASLIALMKQNNYLLLQVIDALTP